MTILKKILGRVLKPVVAAASVLAGAAATAAGGGIALDRAPADRATDVQALQRGAKLFVNYCLNCHAAQSMRYNRLQDIGLTEAQIKENLLFTAEKVGELMTTSLSRKDGKEWFGAPPPDLSVIARARSSGAGSGADWLYTYLRTFYRDPSRETGWNNLAFSNVGMPHVLYELQGEQVAKFVKVKDPHDATKTIDKFEGFEIVKPGRMSRIEYDNAVADLVGFMVWMGEPVAAQRKQLGIAVMIFLGLFLLPCAWWLNRSFWKDIH
ncbi:MAG: cytochrome c1 [Burkholderiales bacterium]|nr:cytochrome c1 [Burkholderiales bacterium]